MYFAFGDEKLVFYRHATGQVDHICKVDDSSSAEHVAALLNIGAAALDRDVHAGEFRELVADYQDLDKPGRESN